MRARFQIITEDGTVLDTELQVRNRFTALHELLRLSGVKYDPAEFSERKGWVQFQTPGALYRTSTRFG